MRTGVFYGIGVGPGDPELVTLKALRVLKEAAVLAVPRSRDAGGSRALEIAEGALGGGPVTGKEILELAFPMTRDEAELAEARRKAALSIAGRLSSGLDVAFITLGDPMLYSTFSYLVPLVREALPGISVKAVPGITSFSAGASSALVPLAETDEKVIIIPAAYDLKAVKEALASSFDTIVLMKVNRNMDAIIGLLGSSGLKGSAVFLSRVGWPDEEVLCGDLSGLKGRKLDYFSTLIIRKGEAGFYGGPPDGR